MRSTTFYLVAVLAAASVAAACTEPTTAKDGDAVDPGEHWECLTVDEGAGDAGDTDSAVQQLAFGPTQVFLNRLGGSFSHALNSDSGSNRTPLVPPGNPRFVGRWPYTDDHWRQVVDCIRCTFSSWNVQFVERPPTGEHIELVMGGAPSQIGQPAHVGGGAPMEQDCSVNDEGIGFVFAGSPMWLDRAPPAHHGDEWLLELCEVASHELGHMLGLEHATECSDPMSYGRLCGERKSFQFAAHQCGEFEHDPRACTCSQNRTSQNAAARLTQAVGAGGRFCSTESCNHEPVITIAECAATPEGETCVLDAALGDALELTATIADADGDSDFYVDYTWGPPDDPFWWWDEGPTFFFDTQDSGPGEFVAAINAYDGCNRGTLEFLIRVE